MRNERGGETFAQLYRRPNVFNESVTWAPFFAPTVYHRIALTNSLFKGSVPYKTRVNVRRGSAKHYEFNQKRDETDSNKTLLKRTFSWINSKSSGNNTFDTPLMSFAESFLRPKQEMNFSKLLRRSVVAVVARAKRERE